MKKFVSLIAVIAAFALVVCLSGCSSEDSEDSSTSSGSVAESSADNRNSSEDNSNSSEDVESSTDEDSNGSDSNSAENDAIDDDTTESTVNDDSNSGDSLNFELDKTVTIGNLTYNVSSAWDEVDSDTVQVYYTDDDEVNGEVGRLDLDSSLTAQEFNDTYMSDNSSRAEGKYENIISDEIENKNISGIDCTVFEYSYDDITTGEHTDGCYAYLPTEEANYVILFTSKNGTEIVEAILDTVTIE